MKDGIHVVSVAEASSFPGFYELVKEHGDDYRLEGMPTPPTGDDVLPIYAALEAAGVGHVLCVTSKGRIIGVAVIVIGKSGHYTASVALVETLFVVKAHRAGGAGARLIRAAEALAKAKGAVGITVNAQVGSELCLLLGNPKMEYRTPYATFFKTL